MSCFDLIIHQEKQRVLAMGQKRSSVSFVLFCSCLRCSDASSLVLLNNILIAILQFFFHLQRKYFPVAGGKLQDIESA